MTKTRVLFVCIHNSARSQMAEAWTNALFGDRIEASSAGLEPGTLNAYAVRVMAENEIDISGAPTKSVFDIYKSGQPFDYVITVCDETAAERCPIFPGMTRRLHWGFPDPSRTIGSDEDKMEQIRAICYAIRRQIETWAPTASEES